MKFFAIVAFLAVPIAVSADCDVSTTGTAADCIDTDPCAADNPCASDAARPCCADTMQALYCCGSLDDISTLDADPEGAEDLEDNADEIEDNVQDLDPEDLDPGGGGTDSAAPKESAIAAVVGMTLVGAALL